MSGIPAIHGHKKTPHPFPGAGFWILRLISRRALTRTSVGNEKYEDEAEKRNRAHLNDHGHRSNAGREGRPAVAVAVRHGADPNGRSGGLSTSFFAYGAIPTQARDRRVVWMDSRPDLPFGLRRMQAEEKKTPHEGTTNTNKTHQIWQRQDVRMNKELFAAATSGSSLSTSAARVLATNNQRIFYRFFSCGFVFVPS